MATDSGDDLLPRDDGRRSCNRSATLKLFRAWGAAIILCHRYKAPSYRDEAEQGHSSSGCRPEESPPLTLLLGSGKSRDTVWSEVCVKRWL